MTDWALKSAASQFGLDSHEVVPSRSSRNETGGKRLILMAETGA
jgi:hypothetical protein